jgi:hypothetical protein
MEENQSILGQTGELPDMQGLINSSLIFARALGLILSEDEGVVVDVTGDINLGEDVKKIIVLKSENQVHIFRCEQDLSEGTVVNIGTPPEDN